MTKKFYQRGELIFEEGEIGETAFIIESGEVEVYKQVEGQRIRLGLLTKGELFGEMAVIDGSPRMANATATEDSVILQLPRKLFDEKLQKFDPVMRTMVNILLENLRNLHKSYMHRPRSVEDYLNAIEFHRDGFRAYLHKLPASPLTKEGLRELESIDQTVRRLRDKFDDHPDPRKSVLSDSDVAPLPTIGSSGGRGS